MDTAKTDRYFFTGFGIWFVVANALGFGASIYYYPDPNGLPFYVTVHGVTFAAWILLYAVQAGLISLDRRKLINRLGVNLMIAYSIGVG